MSPLHLCPRIAWLQLSDIVSAQPTETQLMQVGDWVGGWPEQQTCGWLCVHPHFAVVFKPPNVLALGSRSIGAMHRNC